MDLRIGIQYYIAYKIPRTLEFTDLNLRSEKPKEKEKPIKKGESKEDIRPKRIDR